MRELSIVLRYARASVTWPVSGLRHVFVRLLNATATKTERPGRGGIPSGSLEALGRKTKSAGAGLAVEGDHADLRWTLAAAIDHLLARKAWSGVALNARRYVLAGQRGERADGA